MNKIFNISKARLALLLLLIFALGGCAVVPYQQAYYSPYSYPAPVYSAPPVYVGPPAYLGFDFRFSEHGGYRGGWGRR
jgi:hypothetical protein